MRMAGFARLPGHDGVRRPGIQSGRGVGGMDGQVFGLAAATGWAGHRSRGRPPRGRFLASIAPGRSSGATRCPRFAGSDSRRGAMRAAYQKSAGDDIGHTPFSRAGWTFRATGIRRGLLDRCVRSAIGAWGDGFPGSAMHIVNCTLRLGPAGAMSKPAAPSCGALAGSTFRKNETGRI